MSTDVATARQEVEALLGRGIAGTRLAPPTLVYREDYDGWALDRLAFTGDDDEEIPALFLHPKNPPEPVPAVLYCHAHGYRYDVGMSELVDGRSSLQGAYGPTLKERGVASLCLDMPAFGGRQTSSETARAKKHLWNGTTLFGQMLSELAGALSFLEDHPDVDASRLSVLGFSMGSTQAFWLAALDERVASAVSLCSFADLSCLAQTDAHDGHGIYMTVAGFLKHWSTGQIASFAAPRPMFFGIGLKDWSTPPDCFTIARNELQAAYSDVPNNLAFHVEPDTGHEESAAMRASALAFLEKHAWR